MKETFQKWSLPLLTCYAAIVLAWAVLSWDGLALTQKVVAIATAIICCHEWEEQRFPGGFLEMMVRIMGKEPPADSHAMYSKPDVFVFALTAVALAVPQVPAFSCSVLMLGVMEGIVHVAGIKVGKLTRPYTPGLVTAEAAACFSIVSIVLFAQSGLVVGVDWLLGFVWLVAGFVLMETRVWAEVGVSPRDLPATYKAAIASALRG